MYKNVVGNIQGIFVANIQCTGLKTQNSNLKSGTLNGNVWAKKSHSSLIKLHQVLEYLIN